MLAQSLAIEGAETDALPVFSLNLTAVLHRPLEPTKWRIFFGGGPPVARDYARNESNQVGDRASGSPALHRPSTLPHSVALVGQTRRLLVGAIVGDYRPYLTALD